MSKRRLTQQQQQRISEQQEALKASSQHEQQRGLVISSFGKQVEIEVMDGESAGSIQRCHVRANIKGVVAGDRVIWKEGTPTGVIVAIEERQSELQRPDNYHKLKPIAANIDQIIIVIASEPKPVPHLIDRYLVAAHANHIQPILLLNKSDLIENTPQFLHDQSLKDYASLGYELLTCSAATTNGLEDLKQALQGKINIFVGQSGVGKTSLINTLFPHVQSAVGALSDAGTGNHTTTATRLFHLSQTEQGQTGSVIDSPGIREFGLWHLDTEQLAEHFIEFQPFLGLCKFRDCRHEQEPQCAITQAIADGRISQKRFNSYRLIRLEMESHQAEQY